jgi:hypothetical protein
VKSRRLDSLVSRYSPGSRLNILCMNSSEIVWNLSTPTVEANSIFFPLKGPRLMIRLSSFMFLRSIQPTPDNTVQWPTGVSRLSYSESENFLRSTLLCRYLDQVPPAEPRPLQLAATVGRRPRMQLATVWTCSATESSTRRSGLSYPKLQENLIIQAGLQPCSAFPMCSLRKRRYAKYLILFTPCTACTRQDKNRVL